MLKIIPLIIIPLFFFIIFLGVENLTRISDEKKENLVDHSNENNQKPTKKTSSEEQEIIHNTDEIGEKIEKSEKLVQKNSNNLEKKKIDDQVKKKIDNTKEILKENEIVKKGEKTEIKENKKSVTPSEKSKRIKTQFGAFSKKNYAYSSKKSIEKKIKEMFPEFSIEVKFEKKSNLYKLINFSNDLKAANQVCQFSKKNKISCLIVK